MINTARILRHLLTGRRKLHLTFPASALQQIEDAIAASEKKHAGQVRFAVEHALELAPLLRGQTARAKAIELFSLLRVWDTEHNSGVLIYLLLADRSIEIVADRGINHHVREEGWRDICGAAESLFRRGEMGAGVLRTIELVTERLAAHFPPAAGQLDELSNEPVVL